MESKLSFDDAVFVEIYAAPKQDSDSDSDSDSGSADELFQNSIVAGGMVKAKEPENYSDLFLEENRKDNPMLIRYKRHVDNNSLEEERANAGMLPPGYYTAGTMVLEGASLTANMTYDGTMFVAGYVGSTAKNLCSGAMSRLSSWL